MSDRIDSSDFVPVGSAASASDETTFCCVTFCVSTSGEPPLTVTVSWSDPTCISTLTFAVNPLVSCTPSRLIEPNPVSVNVTV